MSASRVVRVAAVTAASIAALVLPGAASAHGGGAPSPGAAGIGDRLYPTLGNGGYDVQHYDVAWTYATPEPSAPITGTVTIDAVATQSLSSFDLDFSGTSDGTVTVNGAPAQAVRDAEDLVITPAAPIWKGSRFRVVVAGYTATPTAVDPEDDASTSFFYTADGSATAPQPDFAHGFLPSNDHPRDKATYTFHLDVPAGTTAVANGSLTSRNTAGGRTVWNYDMPQPLATELIQIAVGDYDVTERAAQDGVKVRDVTPKRLTAQLEPALSTVTAHLPWMKQRVGAYPFTTYGSLVVDDIPFALETQTISIYGLSWFTDTQGVWEPTMVHELAHQWFGDSVAPWEWSDIWLNEGHATWYELLYAEEHGQLTEDSAFRFNEEGYADLESYWRANYAAADNLRAQFGPVAAPPDGTLAGLFNPNVYDGGALVLYALRQKIGVAAFDALERAWVSTYANGVASTADFIALASKVSGRDLTPFLTRWLYGDTTPKMPGHPDWTVDPVQAPEPVPVPVG
jgi:aminopeptidase N